MSTTKPGNAEKVAAIKAILEAAKTELNLIEQICLKDTDIGKNEEVIRAKENLCCLMAPPMSVPKGSDDAPSESGGITQEQLDAAQAAQAEAEKEAAKAKAEKGIAEKEAADAKAAATKAKADAAAAIAAAGGDQTAKDTAQTDIDEAIKAAVDAAKATAQVEIDAANARAKAAESGGVDEKDKVTALAAAKQIVDDKHRTAQSGESVSKEQKIPNYKTKFLPFPKIIQIMTTYIQKQIDPSFKATILANGMVIFTKEHTASGAAGKVQWGIPAKPADVVGLKPKDITFTGQPDTTASLASELNAAVKVRKAKVDTSMGESTEESTEAPAEESTEAEAEAEASTGTQPAGRPKGASTASTGARTAVEPTGSKTQLKGDSKGARTAVEPTGSKTQLKEDSKGARTAAAPPGSGAALRGSTKTPAAAQTAAAPPGSGAALRGSTKTPAAAQTAAAPPGSGAALRGSTQSSRVQRAQLPRSELDQQQTEEIVRKSSRTAGTAAPPMAEGSRRGGLRRSKRKDTT